MISLTKCLAKFGRRGSLTRRLVRLGRTPGRPGTTQFQRDWSAIWIYNPRNGILMQHGFEESGDVQNIRLVIDTIPTLAWSAGPDGSAEFFNQRWLDYTGLSAKQALGSGWEVAIHPDDLPRILETFREALNSVKPYEVEGRFRRFDGEFRWFLFRGSPLRDRSGKVAKWYGTNTDLEERKRADQALRKSEERWTSVFENSAIGVALTDHNGRFLATSHVFQAMVGYTEEELRAASFRSRRTGTYQPKTDLAGCLNNSTRRIPTDTLDVDPVNDPPSRAEKQFLRKSPKVNRRDNK